MAAVVDGQQLGLLEFRAYWSGARDANRSEVAERVVGREIAVQRGIRQGAHEKPSLSFIRKRAMVRALLRREVDRTITERDLSTEAVDREVSKLRARLGRPAGMRASHLLVMPGSPDGADKPSKSGGGELGEPADRKRAQKWARRLRSELPERPGLPDLFELRRRYEERVPDPLRIVVDPNLMFPAPDARSFEGELPTGWMRVVEPFAEAADDLLGRSGAPRISEPVESRYGWHLVLPSERLPAKVPESEPLRELAISRLLKERRAERFEKLVGRWMSGASVAMEPSALDRNPGQSAK